MRYGRYEKSRCPFFSAERKSGLDVREAVVRFYSYLSSEESKTYDKEVDYLLETLGVEVELPF